MTASMAHGPATLPIDGRLNAAASALSEALSFTPDTSISLVAASSGVIRVMQRTIPIS